MKTMLCLALGLLLAATVRAADAATNPRVVLETSKGTIEVELFADKAPKTVASFLTYVESGFYDGTIFHRVIPGFMVQCGGFEPGMRQKPTETLLENEADNGLKNSRGTLAMARRNDPHSASSQFFINLVENSALDHRSKTLQGWGYAVFGKVVSGMEVVDAIAAVRTGRSGMHADVPVEPVTIDRAAVKKPAAESAGEG